MKFRRRKIKLGKYSKYVIFVFVFIVAIIYYTFHSNISMKNMLSNTDSIPESTLPRIYVEAGNEKINQLRAYKDETVNGVFNETLTIVPEDRKLILDIYDLNISLKGIAYEVRDKYTDALVERTQLENKDLEDLKTYQRATLRIQNLIGRDQEYNLKIRIESTQQKLYYYTTIVWLSSNKVNETLALARDFVEKSFNKTTGMVLINYMESNANADINQLNEVTLSSNYDQITWGSAYLATNSTVNKENLNMSLDSEIEFTLLDAKTYCYIINAEYLTKSVDEKGKVNYYHNINEYVFRTIDNKVLVMKYKRTTEEYLDINNLTVSGKRLYLGITNKNNLNIIKSNNKKYITFVKQKELYVYNDETNTISRFFTFRNEKDKTFKNIYDKYDVKVLKVTDEGNINFLVYGYQNRGRNEGQIGIILYTYNYDTNTVTEDVFIPVYTFYEDLRQDIARLAYLNQNNIFTTYFNGAVYTVDLTSKDIIVLVNNVSNDSLKVSQTQRMVSWEQLAENKTKSIVVLDNETNATQTINAVEDQIVINCGFLDEDLCYGIGSDKDLWTTHNREIAYMVHTLKFFNTKTGETKSYVDETFYFQNFTAYENRLKYKKFIKLEETGYGHEFQYVRDDIIINTQHEEENLQEIVRADIHKYKKRVYYLVITATNAVKKKESPALFINIVELSSLKEKQKTSYFYSYDNAKLINKRLFLSDAVKDCKDKFGFVKYKGRTVWNRANKPAYVFLNMPVGRDADYSNNLQELKYRVVESTDFIIMDGLLLSANEFEYYIAQHMPVTVYLKNGEYIFVTSFNGKIYRTYNPLSNVKRDYTYAEMENLLEENGYNVVCALRKSRY